MPPPAIFIVFPFHQILWKINIGSILILKALPLTRVIKSAEWNSDEKVYEIDSFFYVFVNVQISEPLMKSENEIWNLSNYISIVCHQNYLPKELMF